MAEQLAGDFTKGAEVEVVARAGAGADKSFQAVVRLDTPQEARYYRHGGILQFVLRQLLAVH